MIAVLLKLDDKYKPAKKTVQKQLSVTSMSAATGLWHLTVPIHFLRLKVLENLRVYPGYLQYRRFASPHESIISTLVRSIIIHSGWCGNLFQVQSFPLPILLLDGKRHCSRSSVLPQNTLPWPEPGLSWPFHLESWVLTSNTCKSAYCIPHSYLLWPFNPYEWLASYFSSQCLCWIRHYGHENKGNDHQLKRLLTVKQILLVNTITNI